MLNGAMKKLIILLNQKCHRIFSSSWGQHVISNAEPAILTTAVSGLKAFAEKLIDRGISKDIALNFSTNGTQLHTDLVGKLIANFKDVGFGVSIDAASKERFEYLRHGADWDIVSANLDHFHTLHTNKEIYVSITCTVSAMNVMYLKEYVDVFSTRWPNFEIFFNMVHFPSWYNSNVFEEFVKSRIVAPLQNITFPNASIEGQIKGIINHVLTPLEEVVIPMRDWSDVPDPNITVETEMAVRRRMFMQQIVAGDLYRGEDFRTTFPELYEIIKPYFDSDKYSIGDSSAPTRKAVESILNKTKPSNQSSRDKSIFIFKTLTDARQYAKDMGSRFIYLVSSSTSISWHDMNWIDVLFGKAAGWGGGRPATLKDIPLDSLKELERLAGYYWHGKSASVLTSRYSASKPKWEGMTKDSVKVINKIK